MKLFGRKQARGKIDAVLKGHELPVFPQGVMKLLRLLRDPDSELADIAAALEWDPGLVVRVLKTVNSAAFGAARRIDSVRHAVSMMGRGPLEQVVLAVAVKQVLPASPARGFEAGRFWHAAFFRASLARSLAGELHPAQEARSFTGGLLQDMALPLLAQARPDDYGPVLEAWHGDPGMQLHVLEKDALGFSHDEVGGHLGEAWELPDSLTSVIGSHHSDAAGDLDLPPALRLVAAHRETAPELGFEVLVDDARSLYGIEPDWLLATFDRADAEARDLAGSLA